MGIGYGKEQLVAGSEWKGKSGPDRRIVDLDDNGYLSYHRRTKDGTWPPESDKPRVCYYPSFCDWATEKIK